MLLKNCTFPPNIRNLLQNANIMILQLRILNSHQVLKIVSPLLLQFVLLTLENAVPSGTCLKQFIFQGMPIFGFLKLAAFEDSRAGVKRSPKLALWDQILDKLVKLHLNLGIKSSKVGIELRSLDAICFGRNASYIKFKTIYGQSFVLAPIQISPE